MPIDLKSLSQMPQRGTKELVEIPLKPKNLSEKLNDVLIFNISSLNFGNMYPGQICEYPIEITSKSTFEVSFRIEILCLDEKFNE